MSTLSTYFVYLQKFPHAWSNFTVSRVQKDKPKPYHKFDPDDVLHYRPGDWAGELNRNKTHCEVAAGNENNL